MSIKRASCYVDGSDERRTIRVWLGHDERSELCSIKLVAVNSRESVVSRLFRRERRIEPTSIDVEIRIADDLHILQLPPGTVAAMRRGESKLGAWWVGAA